VRCEICGMALSPDWEHHAIATDVAQACAVCGIALCHDCIGGWLKDANILSSGQPLCPTHYQRLLKCIQDMKEVHGQAD
jgi:hypothetical protein